MYYNKIASLDESGKPYIYNTKQLLRALRNTLSDYLHKINKKTCRYQEFAARRI